MRELRKPLCAAVFVSLLSATGPVHSEQVPATNNIANLPTSTMVLAAAEEPTVAPPAKSSAKAVHHKKTKSHAKNHHRKKSVKTSSAHKAHSKHKTASAHHAKKTKHASAKPKHRVKTAAKTHKHNKTATVVKPVAPVEKTASYKTQSKGTNNVAYTFCLGYDNCVPTRYETTGKMTRVLQKSPEGVWKEAAIDPVMASDLHKLAQQETDSTVIRELTPAEKAEIASHQGQVHAELVGHIRGGTDSRDEAKAIMRELKIRSANDLEAYDPRLRKNPAAIEVANELAAEHVQPPIR